MFLMNLQKKMQFISSFSFSYVFLYTRCKFHSNIPNDCRVIANLPQEYFNLGHPVGCTLCV